MTRQYILLFLLNLTSFLFSRQIHVPADISTIQNAIDTAVNGDSVIVAAGTYQENLNFKGKNITVASRFILTHNPDDIIQTVIDGGQKVSVVIFENWEDSTAILCGFTLTNGKGYITNPHDLVISSEYGGGIFCKLSNPTLRDLIIRDNISDVGGGIYCYLSVPHLNNILVSQNSSQGGGGGIFLDTHSDAVIHNVRIIDNEAGSVGGGLLIDLSNPILKGTQINNNKAEGGGGIAFFQSNARFDSEELCSIHSNLAIFGKDLYSEKSDKIIVNVDTFTVKYPSIVHAMPMNNFLISMNTGFLNQVGGDIYISSLGDDQNSGLQSSPFRTISHALYVLQADSLDTVRVFIMEGRYTPNTNEQFPLFIPDYITMRGEGQSKTILSSEESDRVLSIYDAENVRIENLAIKNGAGGIDCGNSNVVLRNLLIADNTTKSGAGIYVHDSNMRLDNIKLVNNKSVNGGSGGAICAGDSKIWLSHASIYTNYAENKGGAIYFSGTTLNFDPLNRCSIYLNEAGVGGSEFYGHRLPLTYVYLDTFTTLNPTDEEADPLLFYIFDIVHDITGLAGSALYVSPQGDDTNSGISWDEPLKTLNIALQKISAGPGHPGTIYLDEGFYTRESNGEIFPIKLKSHIILKGAGKEKTVFKADQKTSVFSLKDIQSSTIEGLSVTNGRGTYLPWMNTHLYFGGGIYCENSEIVLKDMAVYKNGSPYQGGGLFCDNSSITLEDVSFWRNTAWFNGGGIYFSNSNAILKDVRVKFNQVEWAGSMTHGEGGGIVFNKSIPTFDAQRRCNIYLNDAPHGRDLSATNNVHVVLDTFTILIPTNLEVKNIEKFTFDIMYEKNFSGKAIYVSPQGSDSNSGKSWDTPLKSISQALIMGHGDASGNLNIYLDTGVYSVSNTGEQLPLQLPDYVSLLGIDKTKTSIEGEGKYQVMTIRNSRNVILSKLTLEEGSADDGGGIAINEASPVLKEIILQNNYASDNGGALYLNGSNPTIERTIIKNNSSGEGGAAIFCQQSDPIIINSTITSNSCYENLGYHGGGLLTYWASSSKPTVINCIFWDNKPEEFYLPSHNDRVYDTDTLTIAYSDIDGGEQAIFKEFNCRVNWLEGNISSDPLFNNTVGNDYSLSEGSPCIDSGTAYYVWDGRLLLNLQTFEFIGHAPDMGALEFGHSEIDIEYNGHNIENFSNFPNPFTTYTRLRFGLPEEHSVSLILFNTLGQKIQTIFEDRIFNRGINIFEIDMSQFSSGTYLYVLKVDDTFKTGKLVLIK